MFMSYVINNAVRCQGSMPLTFPIFEILILLQTSKPEQTGLSIT